MRILDLSFFYESQIAGTDDLLKAHVGASGHFKFIAEVHEIHVIKFMNFKGEKIVEGVHYHFCRKPSILLFIFWCAEIFKKIKPQIIITHGFIFPIETLLLKIVKPLSVKIIVQHHADSPYKNPFKRSLQILAYSNLDRFLFTSIDQARVFHEKRIISSLDKVFTVMEGSTDFSDNRRKSNATHVTKTILKLLWVGRLDRNKDPLTVLNALLKLKNAGVIFEMNMIYSADDLEKSVADFIEKHQLHHVIKMIGKIPHVEIEKWYNETDFLISASHSEGSGWAVAEAMACGCVPIVTKIPSFIEMTANGNAGLLYDVENSEQLFNILMMLDEEKRSALSKMAKHQFSEHLSHQAISNKMLKLFSSLVK